MNHPDAKMHLRVSLVKSLLRIGAGLALVPTPYWIVGVLLILAEVLGIVEELV